MTSGELQNSCVANKWRTAGLVMIWSKPHAGSELGLPFLRRLESNPPKSAGRLQWLVDVDQPFFQSTTLPAKCFLNPVVDDALHANPRCWCVEGNAKALPIVLSKTKALICQDGLYNLWAADI